MKDDVEEDDAGALSSTSVPETTISYGNPRASRNMAEKQRRDNLNTNISAMAVLVPTVAESSRKMDKISILRLASAFLRIDYTVGRGTPDFLPRELGDLDLEQYIIDNLIGNGGFFIIVTTTGKIVYVSRQVHEHLGHTQRDLLGQTLFHYVHQEDHEVLTKNITPDEMQGMVSSSTLQITDGTNDNSNSSEDSTTSPRNERRPFREQRRSFELRMQHRTASRREDTQYEWFEISGMLRLADACKNSDSNAKRAKHREINSTSNDIVFVGIARLLMRRPITKISIIDANKDEYITRHLVDGRIIYCDHRVSVVAGYLSEEVSGKSAFCFMHRDDRRWAMMALRQMYDRAETCGSSCYRLTSKTGEPIYLRTHGYLEVDKDTQKVVSLVCINTLVSEEDGIKFIEQMKKRFSATVTEAMRAMIQSGDDDASLDLGSDSPRSTSKSSVEDPSQLEDAITYLVSDLSSPLPEDCLTASPVPNEQYVKAAMVSQHLPPAEAQARKLGIKKLDHYLVVQGGKANRNQKESKNNNKHDSDLNKRQENARSPGKGITLHDVTNQTHSVHDDAQSEQFSPQVNSMMTNDSTIEPCMSTPRDLRTSHLDVPQNMDILSPTLTIQEPASNESSSHTFSESSPCNITVDHSMDVYKRQQEPIMDYLENVVDNTVPSDSKSHQYLLKRIYSDEDIRTSCNKKRHSNIRYVSTDNDEQQNMPYVGCKSFVGEEYSELSTDFNQYNSMNPQSLKVAESPNLTLNDVIVDYQQVDSSMPLIPPTPDDDQFIDLHDLKDDPLLSPSLDANPDLIMKILDDFESSFNETKVQQLTDNNAINNEIRRKHIQLMNSMALQESQLNVLAQDLKNPALQAKRGSLTPLQAEHNMQKQILETLQQHHHNIQVNIKHNIGV
ncbi:PREDICTED: neuronal PAS domain-containing protein 2-like isoform X2 [Habropoda laboriosa]|uniref:neuronal PAS domain-containing protein 2-like isoform X2 n=1 Tax=Habropoda laboriosa TaxID=597456 RepID=UPI00083E6886|nr:PREDICTED: neuronal PAS domain-containing protein 2-like isoform X2 [Habropoda laboriosa]XP_017787865.1 PREDICTED: neuronal PAS domain-containing protein 2-like isoform X2 [Habropoda laboriosa]